MLSASWSQCGGGGGWAAKKRGRGDGVENHVLGRVGREKKGEQLSQSSHFPSGVISQQGSKVS